MKWTIRDIAWMAGLMIIAFADVIFLYLVN